MAKILNLNPNKKANVKKLRYQNVIFMTDQDNSGSQYKNLVINSLHNEWPNLLKHGSLMYISMDFSKKLSGFRIEVEADTKIIYV